MEATQLEKSLVSWTVKNSGYDEHRNYIGLSSISDCPLLIFNRFFNRTGAPTEAQLKTRLCYEIEANLKDRLAHIGILRPGKEISLYDGLVKGHTDGEITDGMRNDGTIVKELLEIKTVPLEDHLPRSLPYRVHFQSQAYLYYGDYQSGHVLYFARDTGKFRVIKIYRESYVIGKIQLKIQNLVEAVKTKTAPKCECGKCRREK